MSNREKLTALKLKNFTLFNEANLSFSKNLNVIVGENGMGKSHLLKVAYSILATNVGGNTLTKSQLQKSYADKLVNVFRAESLGRLVRRKQGRERCEINLIFGDKKYNCHLNFSSASKSEVQIDTLPTEVINKKPVFLPTRELLTIYPNFVHTYLNNYLDYEETYYDTCLLLGALAVKGPREENIKNLLAPLEEMMGGNIVLDNNGRFYLKIPGQGNMEMPLVAEGLRKLAMVARLIATGSLIDKGTLFWDEPEANLNPKLIKLVARLILLLCNNGIQVFIATHSLFLLRELEILSKTTEFLQVQQRFFGLKREEKDIVVEQSCELADISTLTMLDEELAQSDRFFMLG